MAGKLYLMLNRPLIPSISFFVNIGNTLEIDKDKHFLAETNNVFDPVLKAIKKCSAHTSISSIKEKMNNNVFSFRKVIYEEILNEINSLETSKSTPPEEIFFKVSKDNADFCQFYLTKLEQLYHRRKVS